jgi:phosphoglycolate phosphatase-like HAD superfamily hydrolase/tRNA(Arg) A34 adenosine deaminase TadA
MLDALIFDIDGTLLDSNPAHVAAWADAFEAFGYRIPPDRIEREIGKGGDRLVPDVLGGDAERQHGAALRERQTELLLARVRRTPMRVLPGAIELLEATRRRGLCAALATSSTRSHLDAVLESAGVDLCGHADAIVTRRADMPSKPAPDLVCAALAAIGLAPTQCAMVGDTRFDALAAAQAGVAALGVLSGGKTRAELLGGGARGVWEDCAALLGELDSALRLVSPGTARLTAGVLEQLMRSALEAARDGLRGGEAPIGCVIADGDMRLLARSRHSVAERGDPTAHAELRALHALHARGGPTGEPLVLATTLEPCIMCLGAAIASGVDTIIYALDAPPGTGARRVLPSCSGHQQLPRLVGGVLADESRALFSEWLLLGHTAAHATFERHLAATG